MGSPGLRALGSARCCASPRRSDPIEPTAGTGAGLAGRRPSTIDRCDARLHGLWPSTARRPLEPRNFPCRITPQARPVSIPRARACGAKIHGSGRAQRLPSARLSRAPALLRLPDQEKPRNGSRSNPTSTSMSVRATVHVRGRLRQNSFERDGQQIYTVDLIVQEFGRLAQGSDRAAA